MISSHILLRRLFLLSSSSMFTASYVLTTRFREAIRSGDYFSAAGYIHSYFDHTVSTQLSPPEATYVLISMTAYTQGIIINLHY